MNSSKSMKTGRNLIKYLLSAIAIVAFLSSTHAQENDTIIPVDKDPHKILRKIDARKLAHNGFNFWEDNFSGHWAGIDFGFNTFVNEDYQNFDPRIMDHDILRSNSAFINLIQQSIGLQSNRNTVGLVTGLGLHLQSYRLNRNNTIRLDEQGQIMQETLYFDQNQKSKLSIVSLVVPLLAEFQVPIGHYKNRMYFSAGPYGSFRISSHTKIKYRVDRKVKLKIPGHYALHDFKYGIMLRTGYRWINFYATWELTPFFIENKGPELTPVSVGVTLISF